jgi:hypothetical protein
VINKEKASNKMKSATSSHTGKKQAMDWATCSHTTKTQAMNTCYKEELSIPTDVTTSNPSKQENNLFT